jgi:hypothetical protein
MTKEDGQGFSRLVTLENIDSFSPLLKRATDSLQSVEDDSEQIISKQDAKPVDPALLKAEALFQGKSIKYKSPFKRSSVKGQPKAAAKAGGVVSVSPATSPAQPVQIKIPLPIQAEGKAKKGALVWKKKLSTTDAQRQKGHPTGEIRLAKAKWKDNGVLIDQTTYFRNKLFEGFKWKVTKKKPFAEEAKVKFDITILGKSLGIYTLAVGNKPSGEAGQHNYTSGLHWNDLSDLVQTEVDLTGRTLYIYAPPEGMNEPFFIEIL